MGVTVEPVDTIELGDRSYVVHDGCDAIVVDPQRDIDRLEAVLDSLDLTCRAVFETHVHNDYVSGGLELSKRTGAAYVINVEDDVKFERDGVRHGDLLQVGDLRVRAIATPGHTATHMAYLVDGPGNVVALFSGGSLLYGGVGRTDLVGDDLLDRLTRAQRRSAFALAELEDETRLFPTHGFGSFCAAGSTATSDRSSTIGAEKRRNPALLEPDEDAFVRGLIAGLTPRPTYYARMAARNLTGAGPVDLTLPQIVDPAELSQRIRDGQWVVDLRGRVAFASTHLRGTVGIELGPSFATYLGWLIPLDSPVTLIGEDAEQVRAAQRQLVRIGIDRPAAAALVPTGGWPDTPDSGAYPRASFAEFAHLRERDGDHAPLLLDVRQPAEHSERSVQGSLNVPLPELQSRINEIPDGPMWVHCASGFRASVAVSLLLREGRAATLVDDDIEHATGLRLTPFESASQSPVR